MKKILLTFLIPLLLSPLAYSQSTYSFKELGKTKEYREYDDQGVISSILKQEVVRVTADSVYYKTTMLDKDERPIENIDSFTDVMTIDADGTTHSYLSYSFNNILKVIPNLVTDSLSQDSEDSVDASSLGAIFDDIELTENSINIPRNLKVGMELDEYEMKIKILVMTMKAFVEDRKVVAKETVTTPTGTYDCFVIESENVIKAMLVGSEKTYKREWYTLELGLVKSESYSDKKKRKLISRGEIYRVY